jgi:putative membrane protein
MFSDHPSQDTDRRGFWLEAIAINGSVTPYVCVRVLCFGCVAAAVWFAEYELGLQTGLGVAPYEVVGVVLALLLVARTNSGYDRWYEARKLWGGIVNQSRNLAVLGLTYGPKDEAWRRDFTRWVALFPHVCRHSLRGSRDLNDIRELLGEHFQAVESSEHMPSYVAAQLSRSLHCAAAVGAMDGFILMQAERERNQLINHIGGCERILKTPLARVFSIKIRRFIFLYLLSLPFAIVDKTGALTPLVTAFVAYPLLSLDQIGIELQNPFAKDRLSHLPLGDISRNIEKNVFALLDDPTIACGQEALSFRRRGEQAFSETAA